jgi:hypothetical protein
MTPQAPVRQKNMSTRSGSAQAQEQATSPATACATAAVPPYRAPGEHLMDLLARLDGLLRRELARGHPGTASEILSLAAITREEVDRLLAVDAHVRPLIAGAAECIAADSALTELSRRIEERVACSIAAGMRLPMIELAHRFGLSAIEVDIVTACLAAELDRRYERIFGYLQDDMTRKQPSSGLLLGLFAGRLEDQLAAHASLHPLAPLRHYRIVELAEDGAPGPLLAKSLRIDERVVAFVLGDDAIDARVARYVGRFDLPDDGGCLTRHQQAYLPTLIAQATRCLSAPVPREKLVVYLHGPRNAGAEALVAETARALRLPVLAVDAEALGDGYIDFETAVFLLFREGLLSQAALFFRDLDRALEQDPGRGRYRALARWAAEMGSIVFVSGEQPWRWSLPQPPLVLRQLELRAEGFTEQLETWRTLVGAGVAEIALHRLVSRYRLPAGAITAAWRMARTLAGLRGEDAPITLPDLDEACRAQSSPPASGLVRRVEPRHDWDDIVLPAAQMEQLHGLCSQARHLSTVYGAWGFERKLSLGKGLSALFSGPPGTGKTLAAEVIAADLDIDLLKIDLSQVVSKYIGETEKNLRQLFDQAAAAHAILLFDEADALLGKRSEVKDAHDRYANTEVAYLLQKMEEYEGIAILATNLRHNIDEAFTRRMRFIVEFPFPEEDDRLRIWQGVWPKQVPLVQDVDLPWLARQFRLSGGNIRNVALAAAFLAAEEQEPVAMRHLMHAGKQELQKMGRLINEEEYRKYG